MNKLNIILKNDISELSKLSESIEGFAEKNLLSPKDTYAINLVLDELVTNIISYAYENKNEHKIEINLELEKNNLLITIIDYGKYFDPTKQAEPKKDIPLEERKLGGFGIHFVRKKMDSMEYIRKENKNMLILRKRLGGDN